jgi:hypothetical protein
MVNTWGTVEEFARRELFYEPPASAFRNALAYFVLFGLTLKERSGSRILRHVFDSFDFGALSGIRGSGLAPRQLVYKADNVVIDLRIEQKSNSDRMALSGQVIDTQLGARLLKGIPILLLNNGEVTLETNTNQCGEFNFQLTPPDNLALLLTMKDVDVLLLLPEPLGGSSVS